MARPLHVAAVLGLLLLWASQAAAYCRQSAKVMGVDTSPLGECVEIEGVPRLFWPRSCVSYKFQREFFDALPNHTESQVRDIFNTAFGTWEEVACEGGLPPFRVFQLLEVSDAADPIFEYDVVNESVVSARSRQEWRSMGHDTSALALTYLWHNPETGEIYDVDMELHVGAGSFGICEQPCTDETIDLLNAVTHEAGHVLGLGHSADAESTMFKSSDDGENKKRSLEADDRAGLCALDLPAFECSAQGSCQCEAPPAIPSTTTRTVCGCRVPGQRSTSRPVALWVGLGLLMALGARRGLRPPT